jgi:hypothetical protein
MTKAFTAQSLLLTWLFRGSAGAAGLSLIAAAYFLVRSYHGYLYQQLPGAVSLQSHYKELLEYHSAVGSEAGATDRDFESYLTARYVEASDVNARNNVSKAGYAFRATQALIIGLLATLVAAVPWGVGELRRTPTPEAVRIVNPVEIEMRSATPDPKPASPPPSQGQPTPERPVGPPNQHVREGEQPKRPLPTPPKKP